MSDAGSTTPIARVARNVRPLIVTTNCSMQMGGEAALGWQLFRVLRARGVEVRLLTHARNRSELLDAWPHEQDRFHFVEDNALHRLLARIGRRLPERLDLATTRFLAFLDIQRRQKRIIHRLVTAGLVNLIHQPAPVSPTQPSLMYGLGVPVIFGPLNGGMRYPQAFRDRENKLEWFVARVGRRLASVLNWLMPGKRHAAMLLVANARARRALPASVAHACPVEEIPENGVDLARWQRADVRRPADGPVRFVCLGRLVDWKAVDLLLEAWSRLPLTAEQATLRIIGDGPERVRLDAMLSRLDLRNRVELVGFLPQDECARQLGEADVLIHPSLLDCGAAVVLEAMAAGLPVIAAGWGGPTEYVTPECGILVSVADREGYFREITSAIGHMARSPELRQAMGKAGQRRVAERYDWEVKAGQILAVYGQALRRERRSLPLAVAQEMDDDEAELLAVSGGEGGGA